VRPAGPRCGHMKKMEQAASPPLTFKAAALLAGGRAARGYGAAPPASRLLCIACGDGPWRGRPGPRSLCGPPQAGNTGRPQPAPPRARRVRWARARRTSERQGSSSDLAFDSQKERKITRIS
jgi:hypothetical protein